MAACNDWRNGDPTGKFEHSEVTREPYGCVVELEHMETTVDYKSSRIDHTCGDPACVSPAHLRRLPAILRVGRLTVPCFGHTSWLGNWCWDGFSVSEESAAKIINYLRDKREAHCIGGESDVFDKINGKATVEAKDLEDRDAAV